MTDKYIGVPMYVSVKNNFLSFEHTHPPHEYIVGEKKFVKVANLKRNKMKLLIKKLANTNFGILLRNSLNFKPVSLRYHEKDYPASISDAFLWRTDNGYKTIFKYSDILDLFYKIKNFGLSFIFIQK